MSKFYAVRKGRNIGIFETWGECLEQVNKYPGAEYKSFKNLSDAENYINKASTNLQDICFVENRNDYAYIDGSYNSGTGYFGWGGFLIHDGRKYIIQGSDNNPVLASMNNVAGEIKGSVEAINMAINLNIKQLTIYHDYIGISKWALGYWTCNKVGTKAYKEYFDSASRLISIKFVHVKGHSGDINNDEADMLAKQAVGL